jgi:hypothetical protein
MFGYLQLLQKLSLLILSSDFVSQFFRPAVDLFIEFLVKHSSSAVAEVRGEEILVPLNHLGKLVSSVAISVYCWH